ncbi:uncharacterized protein LOC126894583 [Daktulosphaira vitifoliae]|uniref:uncharacterized protein LOC126894583 n=1 Tax=Daktulosphaira vitifoliae TaxID=58002 RepID=UPI0021AAD25E|nr:uncharacterized protein LOC126894583 [Daktulosphaira vitifoliae]
MISFFIYGKFVVNPCQYNLAMCIIDVTRLQQQKKDTLDVSLTHLSNSALLSSMNEFCDNCKKNNEFLKSIISFKCNTLEGKSIQFFIQENVKNYVKNIFLITNIPCVIKMTNISHDFIYKAVSKKEVAMDKEYENKKKDFLQSLKLSKSDIETLERNSIYFGNDNWYRKERRKRLSASFFHRVCKYQQTSSKEAILRMVMRIRNEKSEVSETENTISTHYRNTFKYGITSEQKAKELFEKKMGIQIIQCGIFIDENLNFLAAQPDGLVEKDGIVEIKCPFNAKEMTPENAIKHKVIKYVHYNKNGDLLLKRTSEIFYQIQGELHITQRQYCYLIIWTPKGIKSHFIIISTLRSKEFYQISKSH